MTYRSIRRECTAEEWADWTTRYQLIKEARQTARDSAPAVVSIYMKEKPRSRGVIVFSIRA